MKVRAVLIELAKKLTPYKESEKIYWNGENNFYSEEMQLAIGNSPTGSRVREMYARFIFGKGLSEAENVEFDDGTLLSEAVKDVVDDVSIQNGAFIHVSYKIATDGEEGVSLVPDKPKSLDYNKCRISREDDNGYPGMIVYKNFNKNDTSLTRQEKDQKRMYYPFNPNQDVVMAQIKSDANKAGYKGDDLAGMLKHYRGQVMYLNLTPKYRYAVSKFDSVYSDLDTEYRISGYFNTSTRGGFLGKMAVLIQGLDEETTKQYQEILEKWLGESGNAGICLLPVENVDDLSKVLRVEQIKSQFNDKQFELVIPHLRRNILGAVNLPEGLAFANDGAMFAGSGEKYIQMKRFFWEQCAWERQKIQDAFWKMGFTFNFIPLTDDNPTTV